MKAMTLCYSSPFPAPTAGQVPGKQVECLREGGTCSKRPRILWELQVVRLEMQFEVRIARDEGGGVRGVGTGTRGHRGKVSGQKAEEGRDSQGCFVLGSFAGQTSIYGY